MNTRTSNGQQILFPNCRIKLISYGLRTFSFESAHCSYQAQPIKNYKFTHTRILLTCILLIMSNVLKRGAGTRRVAAGCLLHFQMVACIKSGMQDETKKLTKSNLLQYFLQTSDLRITGFVPYVDLSIIGEILWSTCQTSSNSICSKGKTNS